MGTAPSIVIVALAGTLLAACQTAAPDQAAAPRISVANQTYDVVYVPVVEFRDPLTGRTAHDSGAATPSLEQCEQVVRTIVARPQPPEYQGMTVGEKACYEVPKQGPQRKIPVA